MINLTICWTRRGRIRENREQMIKRFNIPSYMSVNFETPCKIKEEDMALLEECQKRGFIIIRYKNGL